MTLEDLTLDVEQHVDIKATRRRLSRPSSIASGKATPGPMANPCNCCLNRNRAAGGTGIEEREWDTFGGSCRSSSPNPAGIERPDVHVVSSQQSCGNQNRTGFWGLPSRLAASGHWDD